MLSDLVCVGLKEVMKTYDFTLAYHHTIIIILLCLYRYLEPFLIYLRYRPSKHDRPTRQLLNRQRLLQPIDELFMVLVCLRLNLMEKDLSHRFNCSQSTVSRVCMSWLPFLSSQLYPLITWPSHELISHHMPAQFRESAIGYVKQYRVLVVLSH